MFLEIAKSKNITYLYKAQYLTVAKGKYKRVRELIGRLDELEKIYDDPISYFRTELEKETEIQNEIKKNNKIDISFKQEQINLIDLINNKIIDEKLEKNAGSLFLQYIYHKLGFEQLLKKIQIKESSKIKMSKLLQLLILSRCIYPNSKLSDFKNKDNFTDIFNLSKDDIYRGLEILNKYKDEIISHLNNNIDKFVKYNLFNTHYDLTNYFIYTDNSTTLIQHGYSKVKNGKPIIQQALLTDTNGIPINYKLFSGNRNDVSTLIDFLNEQKKRFNIKNTTIVADAGLVSNDNIIKVILSGNKYIFKHSLLRVNSEIMSTFEKVVKPKLDDVMEKNQKLKGCFFSITLDTMLTITDIYGNNKKVSIPQKYIFTYSKKIDERFKNIRLDELENAEKYIKDSSKLKNTFKNSLPLLIKANTKNTEVEIDEKKLDKYEKTSGYSLIITNDFNKSDKDIIDSYKKQYLIEESFRICKTNLDIDNIYLRKDNRIEGHFLVGFLSLTFLRIIQSSLKNEHSINEIQKSLKEFNLCKLRDTNYYQLSNINLLIAKLQHTLNLEINQNIYDGKEIRTLIGKIKK